MPAPKPIRPPLTRIQRGAYTRLGSYIRRHGFAPTYRELMRLCDFTHVRSVVEVLDALERKGYIAREKKKSRAIRLVEAS